jgi:hypothetical protein
MSTQTSSLAYPVPVRRWARIFAPSLADLCFIAVIVWSFAAGAYGWHSLLMDGDVGMHIRVGDHILTEHSVPNRDFLTFSRPGEEWHDYEWLTQATFSYLHGLAGLKGVVLLSGVVIASAFTVLLLHALWSGANVVIALVLVLMSVNASYIHFHARPHIFTLLFVSIAMWLIAADRRQRTRTIWLLVPITVLWANLHAGFFVLFAMLGLLVAGSLLESLLWGELASRGKSDAIRFSLVGAACLAASLINPFGAALHLSIRSILRSDTIRNGVQEFQSPSFRSESMFHYMILLFLGLAISAVLLRKHRLTEVLWIGYWAYNSLVSVRHVPLFAIVVVPILALEFTVWWNQWAQAQPSRSVARTLDSIMAQFQGGAQRLSIWAPAVVLGLALSHTSNWPENFVEGVFPVKVVAAHADEIANSRIYTSDKWAGYLIYKNYPRQKVFFDDRHQYYTERIIGDYLKLAGGNYQWRELLERYRFDMVLCETSSPLASLMKLHPAWSTVEDDGSAILFRRNL